MLPLRPRTSRTSTSPRAYSARHRPQQESAERAVAVRGHHDQIGVLRRGHFDDGLCRVALPHHAPHGAPFPRRRERPRDRSFVKSPGRARILRWRTNWRTLRSRSKPSAARSREAARSRSETGWPSLGVRNRSLAARWKLHRRQNSGQVCHRDTSSTAFVRGWAVSFRTLGFKRREKQTRRRTEPTGLMRAAAQDGMERDGSKVQPPGRRFRSACIIRLGFAVGNGAETITSSKTR